MPTSSSAVLRPSAGAAGDVGDDRAWFLKGSGWDDPIWVFAPTNALEERQPVRLRWDFALSEGRRFTDERYAALLQTSKQLIGLIRTRSLCTGLPLRPSSVLNYFLTLRFLVRWMDHEGLARFADLDAPALLQFQRWLVELPMARRSTRSPSTMQRHLYLFTYLYRFRGELDDGLPIDPFPGANHRQAAGDREGLHRPWPYTPDPVAVALLQAAVDMVTQGAPLVLQAREVYRQAMAAAEAHGTHGSARIGKATRALRRAGDSQANAGRPVPSVAELVLRIDMLYAACYVVLSFLVGPRVSEILHLQAGCVRRHEGGAADAPVTVIVGAIFKRQPGYHGRPHEWVAPPVAVQAISVLEALSAEHRAISGRQELWLRRRRGNGATEWHHVQPEMLQIASHQRVSTQLQRFGSWLGLTHQGRAWRLTTHQGRKTFARFAALRDRSCLFALAQHLGHRERAQTDHGYVGSDYRLNQEIDAEILEQSVAAWEHMLAAPGLGGRAGAEIVAKRPRFRGSRMKQDLKGYARLLVDGGLVLGVCDWGFCVYREEHSACLGNAAGPNPARREPSTCARCKNFAVSVQHRPYWLEQVHRCEHLLNEPALPLQSLRIVRERLNEATLLLRAIDAEARPEADHG
jgi:integrase